MRAPNLDDYDGNYGDDDPADSPVGIYPDFEYWDLEDIEDEEAFL